MTKIIEEDEFDETELFNPAAPAKTNSNPLSGYFRIPGLSVQIPTRGRFLPKDAFNPSMNGEVSILPMKASDEMLLRSPDALMSGDAIENLLLSCVPAISTPRLISTPDLDVLLLGIRAATYGETMELEIGCPSCGNENAFNCHLPHIIGNMKFIEEGQNEIRLNDEVVVTVRPYNLAVASRIASESFNQTRAIQVAQETQDEDQFQKTRNEIFAKMSDINTEAVAASIMSITIPTGTVTDYEYILEFLKNTNQAWVKKIEAKLDELNKTGIDRSFDAKCAKCEHEWTSEIEFDPASFFDLSS
jgi:hypothetical protein